MLIVPFPVEPIPELPPVTSIERFLSATTQRYFSTMLRGSPTIGPPHSSRAEKVNRSLLVHYLCSHVIPNDVPFSAVS